MATYLKKAQALEQSDKETIAEIFQPLLSNTFGGEKYKKFYPQDMKETIRTEVVSYIQKHNPPRPVKDVLHSLFTHTRKVNSTYELLIHITNLAMINESIDEGDIHEEEE